MSKHYETHLPHPWHGLEVGPEVPKVVTAFIEITPFDSVKFEVEKETGYIMVDRPQKASSQCPCLYGFVPRTYCGDEVYKLAKDKGADCGDGDPLDICVISERPISKIGILVHAKVIGGLQMIDCGEVDDKIIAVIEKDAAWGDATDIKDLPEKLIQRLRHYFLTYKGVPGESEDVVSIDTIYGVEHAYKVIEASMRDYKALMEKG